MAACWLDANKNILRKTKSLVLYGDYAVIEYKDYAPNNVYECPIQTIFLISIDEDCSLWSDSVGFARKRLLVDLKSKGFNIDDEIIRTTPPYISQDCSEEDDNFYKNQCIDLINDIKEIPINEPSRTQKNEVPYIHFLDKNHHDYVPIFALIVKIHHDMNFLNRYEGESVKQNRIKMFLEEYGLSYKYSATDTHAKNLAQIIPNRKEAKNKTIKIIENLLTHEEKVGSFDEKV